MPLRGFLEAFGGGLFNQEWFRANQTKKSEVRELSEKESGTGSGTPFASKCYIKPLEKGVPELIPDSFLESSRTSRSSVWFAGTTPDSTVLRDSAGFCGGPRDFPR